MARAPRAARPVTVAPAQYDAPSGWEVGNVAPEDRYVEVGPDGAPVEGAKATKEPKPGAYSRQVSAKGDYVTDAQRDILGLNDDKADDTDESGDA